MKTGKKMNISDIYQHKKGPVLSVELSPKDINLPANQVLSEALTSRWIDYVSVTYGAGGSEASYFDKGHLPIQIPILQHLTSIKQTKDTLPNTLEKIKQLGVNNILAMRGDSHHIAYQKTDFPYAKSLIKAIDEEKYFNIGAVINPLDFQQNSDKELAINRVLEKVESGASFFISQFFFDNDIFFNMQNILEQKNINIPISVGIMPITSLAHLNRMQLIADVTLPQNLIELCQKYENQPNDFQKAGFEFTIAQVNDLLNAGVDGIHLFSLNSASALLSTVHSEIEKRQ